MMRASLYFAAQRVVGSEVRHFYGEFIQLERASFSELRTIQDERLRALLRHAALNVPHYQAHIRRRPSADTMSLADFPILTRADVRQHFKELMTAGLAEEYGSHRRKLPRYSWVEVKTGGSTGAPVRVIHDREYRDRGRAARLYSQRLCGFPFGTPYFRLWGSMVDINRSRDSWSHRLSSFLAGETMINAFMMHPTDMDRYIDVINSSDAHHLMAYVDAAHELARYSQRSGKRVRALKSVMACAGTLTSDSRQVIEEVFGGRVHDKYGSRDCADIACECEEGGLHIYTNNLVLEVVDSDGRACPPGQSGQILVTLLANRSFPMIRYQVGDRGAYSEDPCKCGRPFPVLARLEGRSVEQLVATDGSYVTPLSVIHLVGAVHNPGFIRRFQLVQSSRTQFDLELEVEADVPPALFTETARRISEDLRAVLGPESQVTIENVAEILPSPNGKFSYTINRMLPQEDAVHHGAIDRL